METVFTADPAQLLIAAAAGILFIMPILTKTDWIQLPIRFIFFHSGKMEYASSQLKAQIKKK